MLSRGVAIIVALSCCVAACSEPGRVAKFERRHRHPEVFAVRGFWPIRALLERVHRRMVEAHGVSGRYPAVWSEISATVGAHENDSVPAPGAAEWHVASVRHTLRIVRADAATYQAHAVDSRGRITWAIDDCGEPRQLLPMYCSCSVGQSTGEHAVAFLGRAKVYFMAFYNWHDRNPRTWSETRSSLPGHRSPVELHGFVGGEHLENDPRALAPATAGASWQPYGSPYSYAISSDDQGGLRIRTFNDVELPNYELSRDAFPARRLHAGE